MKTLFAFLSIALLLSCSNGRKTANQMEDLQDQSGLIDPSKSEKVKLNWQGEYRGITPCADCFGIATLLTLNKDETFEKSSKYIGKGNSVFTKSGTFRWIEDGSVIELLAEDGSDFYRPSENELEMLDEDGRSFQGSSKRSYFLAKSPPRIVNTYWKVIEISGQKLNYKNASSLGAYLIFRSNNQMQASIDCNQLFATFKLHDEKLSVQSIGGTKRACPKESLEPLLLKTAKLVVRQEVLNNQLLLYSADEKLLIKADGIIIEAAEKVKTTSNNDPNKIVGRIWEATEVMGQSIKENASAPQFSLQPNLTFSGNASCNSIFGQYSLKKNWIAFSEIAMTEMNCEQNKLESKVLEALEMTERFIMPDSESLHLIVGKRAPLAKFKAVSAD